MKGLLLRLWCDEAGQDLTEYALILVLLSLVAIASMNIIAQVISTARWIPAYKPAKDRFGLNAALMALIVAGLEAIS